MEAAQINTDIRLSYPHEDLGGKLSGSGTFTEEELSQVVSSFIERVCRVPSEHGISPYLWIKEIRVGCFGKNAYILSFDLENLRHQKVATPSYAYNGAQLTPL